MINTAGSFCLLVGGEVLHGEPGAGSPAPGSLSGRSPAYEAQPADETHSYRLRTGALPSAVIAVNDLAAIGLVQRLGESGVAVPGAVSVIGYDSSASSSGHG